MVYIRVDKHRPTRLFFRLRRESEALSKLETSTLTVRVTTGLFYTEGSNLRTIGPFHADLVCNRKNVMGRFYAFTAAKSMRIIFLIYYFAAPKSVETITSLLVKRIYHLVSPSLQNCKAKFDETITMLSGEEVPSLSMTTDMWELLGSESYIVVTGHFLAIGDPGLTPGLVLA